MLNVVDNNPRLIYIYYWWDNYILIINIIIFEYSELY
jgi:hypothetical protein